MTAVLILNALLVLGSGVSGVLGVLRPTLVLSPAEVVTPGVTFFAQAYAVRAVPLSAVALVLFAARPEGVALAAMLVLLGLVQAGDGVIGFRRRILGMTIASTVGAVVHLASAVYVAAA
ncbi:MAG: hypothetical protein HOU81_26735 [Hamadaea sp.]|uniref:hypothetical protein n=1 Tax=Hamadaea sp. TaxID=2024425 RepID=UPI0017DDC75B|nr:hypothetical protein [Hamadaea sp.]NUR74423.1 hypothetical protein [Hamadaea sp.]NUT22925.1 hypothetical protein [Hamadaea sp.]